MSALPDKFNWGVKLRRLEQVKRELPQVIANMGQRFFLDTFDQEEWEGKTWKPRKNKKNAHALLVKTGVLRGGVARSIREVNFNTIRWAVGVSYAVYHNEGDGPPKRQFFGDSRVLRNRVRNKIDQYAKGVFRK